MSVNVNTMYAQQYANTIMLLLQQRGSKLSDTVMPKPISGAKAAVVVEQIGKVEAKKRTTRYPSLVPQDTPHDRPWVYPVDYDWNDLIDSIDKLRTVVDPQSSYALNGTYAMGRAKDNEIIGAFFADRNTGENGTTVKTYASEGSTVLANFGAAGNVGLTVAKLREAKRIMMAAEVDLENDPLTIAFKAKQHDNLLAEMQVVSTDFNEKPVLVEGRVTRFLGFNFKQTELIQSSGGNDLVAAYAKSGMTLATWNDISTDISQRKDLAGLPFQVYVFGTFGSVRIEGLRVIQILCA